MGKFTSDELVQAAKVLAVAVAVFWILGTQPPPWNAVFAVGFMYVAARVLGLTFFGNDDANTGPEQRQPLNTQAGHGSPYLSQEPSGSGKTR